LRLQGAEGPPGPIRARTLSEVLQVRQKRFLRRTFHKL